MRRIERTGDDFVAEFKQRCKLCDENVLDELVTPTNVGYVHAVHYPVIERLQELQQLDATPTLVVKPEWYLAHEGGQNDCVAFLRMSAPRIIVASFDPKARRGHGYRYGGFHNDDDV